MKDDTLLINTGRQTDEGAISSAPAALSDDLNKLLSSKHELISNIIDLDIEWDETNLFRIFKRASRDYVYSILWITVDPKIFEQMTETLNKQRRILEDWKPDNYKTIPLNKAA
ncbi:MAG: hypothetical protein ACD_2C00182G0007 [uncultured bacterium (gcode 4)]|uniref:Uncharacterized protein n=1 Tax=uncultured bacterium (gcode 4) TaxID=1234023 RepID=K2G4Z5_9BACT|nr:MAG: hypothetical protein ACD_2C00182G0007 [uncultured bacterium (gcode 4)]